jgi:MFS family permease
MHWITDLCRNGLNIEKQYTDYFDLKPSTQGLLTASIYMGGAIAGMFYGKVTDAIGRRPALLWAAVLTIFAVALQTAAQNPAMFVVARILIGLGTSASGLTGPAYLAETLPSHWRAWSLGIFNDFYYVVRNLGSIF